MPRCKGTAKGTGEQCKKQLKTREYCKAHEDQAPISNVSNTYPVFSDGRCSFIKDEERCVDKLHKDGLCESHFVLKERSQGRKCFLNTTGETQKCEKFDHDYNGSLYQKDKVPIEKFQGEKKRYKRCKECREVNRLDIENKRLEIERKNEELSDPEFKICAHPNHDSISEYPREKVPIEMFTYTVKKDNSKLSVDCSDCRGKHAKNVTRQMGERQGKSKEIYNYVCNRCPQGSHVPFLKSDGSKSKKCPSCQNLQTIEVKRRRTNIKESLKKIRLEKIMESECSCAMCKSIFLVSDDPRKPFKELKTYIRYEGKKHNRYVQYKGKEYLSRTFLQEFVDKLELRIIEFDHVPLEEQEARGMIKPGEEPIIKKCCVTECTEEISMREEARITQNLCCMCHLWVTRARLDPDGNRIIYKRPGARVVEEIKRASGGCSNCGFFDEDLLGYLEFDHLDPPDKILAICELMYGNDIEKLILECKKCRILCRACHKIHTSQQVASGIFNYNPKY
jgi:hypothetical protein